MAEIYLIDGSYYLHRAFHAQMGLATSTGIPTNATYLFARMLLKLLKERRPAGVVMVFDAKGKTFRSDLYPAYKAHRPPMADELVVQIPYIHRLVEALGIPLVSIAGVEGDDCLATLATRTAAAGDTAVLVTRDKDLMQLVGDAIRMWDSMNDEELDAGAVTARLGVLPRLVPDYLALVGDSADNIPGVAGIGPKGAAALLAEHGSLEALLDHAGAIKGKRGAALRAGADTARLAKRLATVRTDVDLGALVLTPRSMDTAALRTLFDELEFSSLARDLGVEAAGAAVAATRLATPAALAPWLSGEVALDLGLDEQPPAPPVLRAITVATPAAAAYGLVEGDPAAWLAVLGPWLAGRKGRWLGHRLKPQLRYLLGTGLAVAIPRFDTNLAAYLLDAGRDATELADLAHHWLGRTVEAEAEGLGKGKTRRPLAALDETTRGAFLGARGRALASLAPRLETELAASGLLHLYQEVEAPLQEVLCAMELTGIRVDRGALEGLAAAMEAELITLEAEIHDLAGEPFNVASPKQLATVLYDRLGLPVLKKTKTGPSTDNSVLEELGRRHPLPARVVAYRSVAKLLNTYVRVLPTLIAADGRIHSRFHQTVAATGRLSSSDPNLQNIPVRSERGRQIRRAFVAPPGWRLLAADYSQIELRLLAHFSGDPDLVHAFARGEDIHRATAARIFGLEPEQVTDAMRRDAKTINFGILYGMGAFRLAKAIDVPQKEAARFIEAYFARYPTVRAYLDACVAEARATGFVTTLLGRRRPLPEVHATHRMVRANAERMATNTPLQGSAADIIKVAMIRLRDRLATEGLAARLLLQVHDELVLEVPEAEVERTRALVVEVMATAAKLSVPLLVDIHAGATWDEAH